MLASIIYLHIHTVLLVTMAITPESWVYKNRIPYHNQSAEEQEQALPPEPLLTWFGENQREWDSWFDKTAGILFPNEEHDTNPEESRSALPVERSPSAEVNVKLEAFPSPEIEFIKEQSAGESVGIKRRMSSTPPRRPFRRTPTPYPVLSTRAATARQTGRRRIAQQLTPAPENRPKIYLNLRREGVEEPWRFVPRRQLKLRLRRANREASWELNRE